MVVESYQMYVEALRSGLGVGILPEYVIDRNGAGIEAFFEQEAAPLPPQELWLVMRDDSVKQDVVRQFSDFLAAIPMRDIAV
jgi:DNA-binding transcriptional LysR family regulator